MVFVFSPQADEFH